MKSLSGGLDGHSGGVLDVSGEEIKSMVVPDLHTSIIRLTWRPLAR